ncbi:hypothetical protein SORBI_3002G164833 [Sorghum bicolor]|uniref:Uncharacterized protein n=1 Tax=Sorghum bicolor TaxID=4558 RepID=A0A1W0W4C8_SORBI|nr:hypothetical protein SORBI_3002G164833 [Sorghum bicolor]
MSACPSCIVYCDFGFCCGNASDDDLEFHAPPPQPQPQPPCHGHTEVITMVNAPIQLPPPPQHPHVIVPYNQLPPAPLPAPPHLLPPAPTTTMTIIPRQCAPPPLPPAEVYDDGSSPLPVSKSTQQPNFGVPPPSRRHETDGDPAAPPLRMVPTTKAASTPAASDVAAPALQHVEPSLDC